MSLAVANSGKTCRLCGEVKGLGEFRPLRRDGYEYHDSRCRACYNAYMREWQQRPENRARRLAYNHSVAHEIKRDYHLMRFYKMSHEEFEALKAKQEDRCAACGEIPTARGGRLFVDHDHETGVIRGLLCNNCNVSIGLLKDDPERIRAVARYLDPEIPA